jgi:hypothetical protein
MGATMSEAYRLAGFTASGEAVHVNASRLAKNAKVVAKVRSILAKVEDARSKAMVSTMIVTASTVTDMLTAVFVNATKDKQHGAAATAAMGLAKVHGLLVDKTEDVTRRAARSPDAPIEIDVEHWLTDHGAPQSSPQLQGVPQGTEPDCQSPDAEPPQGAEGSDIAEPAPTSEPLPGSDETQGVKAQVTRIMQ